MARFCSQCGNEIEPDSKFCSKCGNPTENESIQNVSTQVAQNKSTGKNNMLIVALIAAIILIGGIGGYIFFGRSSDDKKSAALSQSNTTQQTTNPVESVPPPKPVEKTIPSAQQFSVNQNSPRDAFISFHMAITNRQLAEAYNILSPNYQKFMRSYDNFARGYNTTLRSDIVDLNELYSTPNFASYSYKLKAVDREGSGTKTQYFAGKATLVLINGAWRIDKTEAKRL